MGIDTIIFDLDGTLVLEAGSKKGTVDSDLEVVKLAGIDYYIAVRPFAENVIDTAHELFKNVYLWTWNPNLREAIPALGWEDKFDRVIWYSDFKWSDLKIHPPKCKAIKDLSLVVDGPESAVLIEDTSGIIEQEDRVLRVEPFLGLGNDDALIKAFLDLERFGVEIPLHIKDNLEEIRDLTLEQRIPKFRTRLNDLTVKPVNGYETAFTPEGLELVDEVGEGILECIGFSGDNVSGLPRRFRKELISDSNKGKLYRVKIGDWDLAFKFYKRKKLGRGQFILLETGLDQLEAAHFINTHTGYRAPTPYFASIDVFCMEYIPGMVPFSEFLDAHFGDNKEERRRLFKQKLDRNLSRAITQLENANIHTSSANFYVDEEYFDRAGRIRVHPFDQKQLMDPKDFQKSGYYTRRNYLDQKYQLSKRKIKSGQSFF